MRAPRASTGRLLVGAYLEMRAIPVLLWSFSAITLGAAAAGAGGVVHAGWLAASLAIGVLLQGFVAHTVNEIVDWRSGTDADPSPRILSGGSKVIAARLLSERELVVLGGAAAAAAVALGLVVAASRGWWLLGLGALGLAGAVLYTLPPAAAAYAPFAGEGVAFTCVWACAIGGYGVQAGTFGGHAVLLGAAHAAFCVSMLMLHHLLDRGPDARAVPPKLTTMVRLGPRARLYGAAWSAAAAGIAVAAVVAVGIEALPMAVAGALAVAAHLRVDGTSLASVTSWEGCVIASGIAGTLGTAIWLAPSLAWVAAIPVIVVPLELAVARRSLAPAAPAAGLGEPGA